MDNPERRFLGGVKKLDAENVRQRESFNYQPGEIFGLNHDFVNQVAVLYNWIVMYNKIPANKQLSVERLIKNTSTLKTYEDWIKSNGISPEKNPAVFAEDVTPYIEAIDEIVGVMKEIGAELGEEYQKNGISDKVNYLIFLLQDSNATIGGIIKPGIERPVGEFSAEQGLGTDPKILEYENRTIGESEALEHIRKRLNHAKELLAKTPLDGSFSYIRKDGNVLPVDWEPTEEDREALKRSDIMKK